MGEYDEDNAMRNEARGGAVTPRKGQGAEQAREVPAMPDDYACNVQDLERLLAASQRDLAEAREQLGKMDGLRQSLNDECDRLREQLVAKEAEQDAIDTRSAAAEDFANELKDELAQMQRELADTKARLQALRATCSDIVEHSGWAGSRTIQHAPSYVQFLVRSLTETAEPAPQPVDPAKPQFGTRRDILVRMVEREYDPDTKEWSPRELAVLIAKCMGEIARVESGE